MGLSFDIAEVAQAVPQSLQRWPGLVRENTDFPKAAGRLRKGRARPRNDRAAEKRDELAAFHCPVPPVLRTKDRIAQHCCAAGFQSCLCPLWVKSGHHPFTKPCSLYPRKRTSTDATGMSLSA